MLNMERRWYRSSPDCISILLLPFSWLFRFLVTFRRFLYRVKFKKTYPFSVPVIVVGNITVGGTGKTPFVIWLVKQLREQGFRPGIVSRGVGGLQQRSPRWVDASADPQLVGDEAILLAKRTQCPLVIGIDRVAAVKELLAKSQCNIVISDDGLQHYRLGRDIEIAIIDGERGLGNQCFIPAGPLREAPKRLTEVDFIVRQGEAEVNEFAMKLRGNTLISVNDEQKSIALSDFSGKTVHAVAAIGNPARFFAALRQQGLTVIEHFFPDHAFFTKNDLIFPDALPVIMTEKDAVKCSDIAHEKCWYLPVEAQLLGALEDRIFKKINSLGK